MNVDDFDTPFLASYRAAAEARDPQGLAGRPTPITPLINRIIRSHVTFETGDTVVDVGCGDASLLASLSHVRRRIGVVPSEPEAQALRDIHVGRGIEFVVGLAPEVPLPDGLATRVICNGVLLLLQTSERAEATLRTLERLAAPGALVYVGEVPTANRGMLTLVQRPLEIVQTHGVSELVRRIARKAGVTPPATRPSAARARYYVASPETFTALARACGFSRVEVHPHIVKLDGQWVEYPRNRFNYILRR